MTKLETALLVFTFEDLCLLNQIMRRPDKTYLMKELDELRENAEDSWGASLAADLQRNIERCTEEELRLIFDALPIDPCMRTPDNPVLPDWDEDDPF